MARHAFKELEVTERFYLGEVSMTTVASMAFAFEYVKVSMNISIIMIMIIMMMIIIIIVIIIVILGRNSQCLRATLAGFPWRASSCSGWPETLKQGC